MRAPTFLLIVCVISMTPFAGFCAEYKYLVRPCGGKQPIREEAVGNQISQKGIPAFKEHNQGKTPTCTFHAANILLSSLAGEHASNIDLIEKLGTSLDATPLTSPVRILDYFRRNRMVRVMSNEPCIAKLKTANDLLLEKPACEWNAKESAAFQAVTGLGRSLVEVNQKSNPTQFPIASICRNRGVDLELPPFAMNVYNTFRRESEAKKVIVDHFMINRSPLALSLCVSTDERKSSNGLGCTTGHSLVARGVKRVYCSESEAPHLVVDILNSWGGPWNGLFELDAVAQGIRALDGAEIVSVEPCGRELTSTCQGSQSGVKNAAHPNFNSIRQAVMVGDVKGLKRQLKSRDGRAKLQAIDPDLLFQDALLSSKFSPILTELLKSGLNFRYKTPSGRTALHVASAFGDAHVVQLLVDRGAPLEAEDVEGITPLSSAALEGQIDVLKYLHEKGASLHTPDAGGSTPLHVAAKWGRNSIVRYLLSKGVPVDAVTKEGVTPLMSAGINGEFEVVQTLQKGGASLSMKDQYGWDPLSYAISGGDLRIVRFLIQSGAPLSEVYTQGRTLLHFAVESGNFEIVKTLIAAGAKGSAKDFDGDTPREEAEKLGMKRISEFLRKIESEKATPQP